MTRDGYVYLADLRLAPGVDPRAVGAAVTTELCGHWEHVGPCRWPHHNAIAATEDGFSLRVVFVAPTDERDEVYRRTAASLHAMDGCADVVSGPDALHVDELPLAARLTAGPSADG